RNFEKSCIRNIKFFFKEAVSWGKFGSGATSFRYRDDSFAFVDAAPSLFGDNLELVLAALNSKAISYLLSIQGSTLNVTVGLSGGLPIPQISNVKSTVLHAIKIAIYDSESYTTSWNFSYLPILFGYLKQPTIATSYAAWRQHCRADIETMQRLEEENNRLFINAYGLQDELTPEVPLNEITLTCNPHYRYGGSKSDSELEQLLLIDTIKELISYAIGCMMGRYSLDAPGLIYAHSGNEGFDPNCYPSFPADEDGIIPITDTDWFADDATNRLAEFLAVAWPKEHERENLAFVATSLGQKGGETPLDTVRRYLSRDFFKDHLKTYKKRPIYWLFSSGKQKAFECLVYLHRYHPGTLSRMRMEYVVPLQSRLRARAEQLGQDIAAASSTAVRNKAQKELDKLRVQQEELAQYDEKLRHFADQRITLDLDDGVKVNYGKLGNLLAEVAAITGDKGED
ncbi:MAG: BREX-1 system adenine-specific DNA-methyltransferase PglX, partial [Magnetococcales bacterium]|nr:BREX-1 system adenine-specific DNA-methyltransferase PglX [Magnetococcales bacterium]